MLSLMKMEAHHQDGENVGEMKQRKRKLTIEGVKPFAICIVCNVCFAGYGIISKISLDNGMSSYVLVVYGQALGALTTALLALVFERTVLGRTLYYVGLKDTSPAAASALSNLVPPLTFIIAVLCRMETLDISKQSGQAKVAGTLVALAGAIVMTLYKGCVVISPHSQPQHRTGTSKLQFNKDSTKGSLMLLVSFLSASAFYVLQTVTVKNYPAPITLTSLTCLSATLLSAIMAAVLDHKASSWRLSWDMNLVAVLYGGIVIFGLSFYLQALAARTKGAVFITAFRPFGTVITTVMALLILGDVLFLGSVMGALLIVLGLYLTLWGKETEKEKKVIEVTATTPTQCVEIRSEK